MNISILGGGTAGWLTALFLKELLPTSNITLIQSKEIGIIGVGEATTPHVVNFLKNLKIDPIEAIKKTNGSIKNGISFENWNGDGKKYFHGFKDNLSDFAVKNIFDSNGYDFYIKNLIENDLSPEEFIYQTKISYENKIDLTNTNWALHFDASLFADYLESVGSSRNIKVVDGIYKTAELDNQGFIKNLILENNCSISTDLVFDCSGFSRLLIGKLYKDRWISYKQHLPMKKGIPFWLENSEEIQPYTSCIAMKYGWMWKIPLQHRTGSGYIFDSDFINEDQALSEAELYFNQKLKINKIIPFEAGRYEHAWIKNCISIGLSSSFIEPLESTSIWNTIIQLEMLRHFVNEFRDPSEKSINLYNEIVANNMDDKLNFVYLHYLTKRNDSEFWKNFRNNYPPPKKFETQLELIKENNLRYFDVEDTKTLSSFPLSSYLLISKGLELFEKPIKNFGYESVYPAPAKYQTMINRYSKNAINHKVFLNSLNEEKKSYIMYTK
jgi:tryptophan 7-halogenase